MKALLTLLKTDPREVDNLSIQQVVALCGTGKLTDNSEASADLRAYLQIAESENLFKYVQSCLQTPFDRSGAVLQDLVNEYWHISLWPTEDGEMSLHLKDGASESLEGFKLSLAKASVPSL